MKSKYRFITFRSILVFFALLFLIHLAMIAFIITDEDLSSSFSALAGAA